jgi:orotate phosphoribosyltransferase
MGDGNLELRQRFLDLLLESGALKFGEFNTKSGRVSPFFFNTGCFDHGKLLSDVARCYAELIASRFSPPYHLYGPAYKGITLAAAVAVELAEITGLQVPFTFNRKEVKDHGEGGRFVGRALTPESPLIIVEDIITGGTSINETMAMLTPLRIPVRAVVVGIDRQERGSGREIASREIMVRHGAEVCSVICLEEILSELWGSGRPRERLGRTWIDSKIKSAIDQYRITWG